MSVVNFPPNYRNVEKLAEEFCNHVGFRIKEKNIFDTYLTMLPANAVMGGISLLICDEREESKLATITLSLIHTCPENPEVFERVIHQKYRKYAEPNSSITTIAYQYTGPLKGRNVELLAQVAGFYREGETEPYREIIERKDKIPVWFVVDQ